MEPSYQTRKIIGRILAVLCAVLLGLAFWAQLSSPVLQQLIARKNTPLHVLVLTQPAMRFTYNPTDRKALVAVATNACERASLSQCFNGEFDFFYQPQETEQNTFWTQFKDNLSTWRYNAAILARYVHAYINAGIQKRTNLHPGVFILLSQELAALTPNDFAVQYPKANPKKKGKKATAEPEMAPMLDRSATQAVKKPLKVIVLNASGKRGLAESLKQYLRAQYAKGLLQVDVYDTGNYPTEQEKSFLIDYSGNLVAVTQLSHAVGINGEIRSEKPTGDIYDTTIVLGKDFEMPL